MSLVEDNHMVEAFSPEGADDSLAVGIRLRRSRRREETSGTAAPHSPSELGAIDGVAVTDEEPRYTVVPSAERLDERLRRVLGARARGHANMDNFPAPQVKDDEPIQKLELQGHDGEPIASPDLAEMVFNESGPLLASASWQLGRAVLGHGSRRDVMAELGQLGGNAVLASKWILLPHPTDECPGVGIDGRAPDRSLGTASPQEPPERAMPTNRSVRAHDDDGIQEGWQELGQGGDGPSVTQFESRARCASLKNQDLLSEQGVLGDKFSASAEGIAHQAEDGSEEFTKHRQGPYRVDFHASFPGPDGIFAAHR